MIIFSEASFSKYEGFRLFHLATGLLPPVSGIDLCRRGISGTSATNAGAGIRLLRALRASSRAIYATEDLVANHLSKTVDGAISFRELFRD